MWNLDCFTASTSCCSISHQLRFDAAIHSTEQISGSIDTLRNCQNAVILKDDRLLVAQSSGNT